MARTLAFVFEAVNVELLVKEAKAHLGAALLDVRAQGAEGRTTVYFDVLDDERLKTFDAEVIKKHDHQKTTEEQQRLISLGIPWDDKTNQQKDDFMRWLWEQNIKRFV